MHFSPPRLPATSHCLGSVAGFQRATFADSRRLSNPLDFRLEIAVANFLIYDEEKFLGKFVKKAGGIQCGIG